jgi:AraC-like DNA-binding protein
MIVRCIEKALRGGCAGCERAESCVIIAKGLEPRVREKPAGRPDLAPLLSLLGAAAKRLETQYRLQHSFSATVERAIDRLLEGGLVSVEAAAGVVGCSRQTIYRKLKAEGATFEQLLEKRRKTIALKLVRESKVRMKEIAYRLGFSSSEAFSHAFKRWTGSSPSEFRHSIRH